MYTYIYILYCTCKCRCKWKCMYTCICACKCTYIYIYFFAGSVCCWKSSVPPSFAFAVLPQPKASRHPAGGCHIPAMPGSLSFGRSQSWWTHRYHARRRRCCKNLPAPLISPKMQRHNEHVPKVHQHWHPVSNLESGIKVHDGIQEDIESWTTTGREGGPPPSVVLRG